MRKLNPVVGIIDRYIIRKFLGTYIFVIALLIVVLVIFDAAEKIDDFIEMKAPLRAVMVDYFMNFVPFFINQFSGLITFIAVIFFTSKMAYDTEIVAILSAGVSFRRLMWPFVLSATVIAILSLCLNLVVIPNANVKRIDFEMKYLGGGKGERYASHIYRQIEPGTFVYIRDFSGENSRASYFVLESYKDGAITTSLEAWGAEFDPESGRWSAPESVLRSFDDEQKETFINTQPLDTLINLVPSEMGKVEERVKTMDIWELDRFIDQQRSKGSDMIAQFEVERHNRFSFPFSTFILTIIGVSLSSRKVRGGTGLHIGLGIVLCFSFILFSRFADEFAKSGAVPAAIAVWVPNFLYSFVAIYLYRKAPK